MICSATPAHVLSCDLKQSRWQIRTMLVNKTQMLNDPHHEAFWPTIRAKRTSVRVRQKIYFTRAGVSESINKESRPRYDLMLRDIHPNLRWPICAKAMPEALLHQCQESTSAHAAVRRRSFPLHMQT
jgi:hypothetical protein